MRASLMSSQHARLTDLCQEILARVQDEAPKDITGGIRSRIVAMMSRLEFAEAVNSSLNLDGILDVLLLTSLGKMLTTTGTVLVQESPGRLTVRAARGPRSGEVLGKQVRLRRPFKRPIITPSGGDAAGRRRPGILSDPVLQPLQLCAAVPIWLKDKFLGAAGFGPRITGQAYQRADADYLSSLASIAATAIENGLIYEEVRALNRSLQLKVFQLSSLFDVSRELVTSFEPEHILRVMITSLMGQTGLRRAVLLAPAAEGRRGLTLGLQRGLSPSESDFRTLSRIDSAVLELLPDTQCDLSGIRRVSRGLARLFGRWGLVCFFPLRSGERCLYLLAVGEKLGGAALERENQEFIATLCSQAVTAVENAQLHNEMVEKERLEKELSIARTIQQSLLPRQVPKLPGLDLAHVSTPCYEVGGDYHDFIRFGDTGLGLAIGDVTGKSTPASLVMASVQASLRALTMRPGLAPAELISQINNLLFHSTEPNRFVSFFYGSLDAGGGSLAYVNAGHNPPLRISQDGTVSRLEGGGLVLGLFENAPYECRETVLEKGDILLLYTDGLSEANNPQGEEFGEERIGRTAHRLRRRSAVDISRGIMGEVARFQQGLRPHDDLTLVVAKKG